MTDKSKKTNRTPFKLSFNDDKISEVKNYICPSTLEDIYKQIVSTKYKDLVKAINNAPTKRERNILKKNLPSFVAAELENNTRGSEYFIRSRLMAFDVDNIKDPKELRRVKSQLRADSRTALLYTTASGKGLRFVVKLNQAITKGDTYAMLYDLVKEELASEYQIEATIDSVTKDCSRAFFLSYDKAAYLNTSATQYNLKRKIKQIEKNPAQTKEEELDLVDKQAFGDGKIDVEEVWALIERASTNEKFFHYIDDYEKWAQFGMSLCELEDIGRDMFVYISSKHPNPEYKDSKMDIRKKYQSFIDRRKKIKKKPFTISTFYHIMNITGVITKFTPEEAAAYEEAGIAERFMQYIGVKVVYCMSNHKWYVWSGHQFVLNNKEKIPTVQSLCIDFIQDQVQPEISTMGFTKAITKILERKIRGYLNAHSINNILEAASTISKSTIKVDLEEFDKNDFFLNCQNVIVNLTDRDARTIEPDPKYLMSNITNVVYDKKVLCPKWKKQVLLYADGDKQLAKFLQKYAGYLLTGSTEYKDLLYLYGKGNNGKTTYLRTIEKLMGSYADSSPFSVFTKQQYHQNASPYMMLLKNKRFVYVTEAVSGRNSNGANRNVLDQNLIKSLTGGEDLKARGLYQEPVKFSPKFKLILSGNDPIIAIDDHSFGMTSRFKQIPFKHQFPGTKNMNELIAATLEENSGILNWAIEGWFILQEEGMTVPASVEKATRTMLGDQNTVLRFAYDCLEQEPNIAKKMKGTDLHNTYLTYYNEEIAEEDEYQVHKVSVPKAFYNELENTTSYVHSVSTEIARLKHFKGVRFSDLGKKYFEKSKPHQNRKTRKNLSDLSNF